MQYLGVWFQIETDTLLKITLGLFLGFLNSILSDFCEYIKKINLFRPN